MSAVSSHLNGRPRSWWLWAGYWLGLFVIMHVPETGTGSFDVEGSDKVVHFIVYFLLAWLGGRHLVATRPHLSPLSLPAWGVFYVAYAAMDEWLQGFVSRTPSVEDWIADLAGIIAATLFVNHRRRRRRLSEPTGETIREPGL